MWMSSFSNSICWMDCLTHCLAFPPLSKEWTVFMWVYFWVLSSVSLMYLSILSPKLCCSDYCSFVINLFFFNIFNWRIIALQYCAGFCHTSTWISHRYRHVPSLVNLHSPPTPSCPSRSSQSTRLNSLLSQSKFPLVTCFAYGNVYVSMLLS